MRRARGVGVALALSLTLASVIPAGGEVALAGTKRSSRRIAPGIKLIRITKSRGPQRIFMLVVNPRKSATLDVGLPGNSLPGYAKTSQIAASHGAIAAVNGDFNASPGRPLHAFMEDGILIQTGLKGAGHGFAVSQDESSVYVGHPAINIFAHVKPTNQTIVVNRWNSGNPLAGQIAAYSPKAGSAERPPTDACSARLLPTSPLSWGTGQQRIAREYVIDKVACSGTSMAVQSGLVLSAKQGSGRAPEISGLTVGHAVRITYTMGWTGAADTIASEPRLIQGGTIVAPRNCGYICEKHPRTAVGVTATGKILLVVVDGRQAGWSIGVTLIRLARLLKREGAVDATNFDGGGSSTMVVKGQVVNRPSGGSERSVSSAVLVLRGPDGDETIR